MTYQPENCVCLMTGGEQRCANPCRRTHPIEGYRDRLYDILDDMWWDFIAMNEGPERTHSKLDQLECNSEVQREMLTNLKIYDELRFGKHGEFIWRGLFPIQLVKKDAIFLTSLISGETPGEAAYLALRFMKPNGRITYIDAPFNPSRYR